MSDSRFELSGDASRVHTRDPIGWISASAIFGLLAFIAALAALWRPVFGLAAPIDDLWPHLRSAASWLASFVFPNVFERNAHDYAAYLRGLVFAEKAQIIWRVTLASLVGLAPCVLLRSAYMGSRNNDVHLRGARRFDGKKAKKELIRALAEDVKAAPDHEIAPGIIYPADLWSTHVLLAGGTGAGKSTFIKPLVQKIIEANERLVLFDPKGDFTKSFSQPILIAPWDARSFAWDIGADMRNIGDMRRVAAGLIKEGHDPMWSNAARQILVGFMLYLKSLRGTLWGWRELADLLATPQQDLLAIMRRHNREAVRSVERASVTTQGILINLASFCSPIYDLAEAWGDLPPERRVSFASWVLDQGAERRQIILQGHGSYPEMTHGCAAGIFGVIAGIINSIELDDDDARRIWIVTDELAQMGLVPIKSIFAVGRSRGARCVAACQDLAQLEEIHGKAAVRALTSMVGAFIVGKTGPGDTAEALSKALGSANIESESTTVATSSLGKTRTISRSKESVPLYVPAELGSRLGRDRKRNGVVMALAVKGNVYELVWPLYPVRKVRPAHKPALWTLGKSLNVGEPSPLIAALPAASTTPIGNSKAGDRFEQLVKEEASNAAASSHHVSKSKNEQDNLRSLFGESDSD